MRKGEIDIITLGCSKNLVDAERLMHQLELVGYRCVHDSATPRGEIAIINTCGFIGDAKEESIEMILQFAERKTKGKLRKLYVMGCLSQRYAKELPAEIPEVDGWFGKFDYLGIVEECAQFRERPAGYSLETRGKDYERTLTTPKHYAYLKIAEGCNRYCSYCAIPLITGKFTARPQEEIVDEVRWLVSQGVKEFNVIAQDLSTEEIIGYAGVWIVAGEGDITNIAVNPSYRKQGIASNILKKLKLNSLNSLLIAQKSLSLMFAFLSLRKSNTARFAISLSLVKPFILLFTVELGFL